MSEETKTTTHKAENNIVSLLKSIVTKSVELPNDVVELAKGVRELAKEVKDMSHVLSVLSQVVYQHSTAIKELYAAQTVILKSMKPTKGDSELASFPEIGKNKEEKPN